METKFLDNLINENEFPVIFIGSGITQRYFKNAPTGDKLLQKLWKETNQTENYFSAYHKLNKKYKDSFKVYTKLATQIENNFDDLFYDEQIKLPNLTPEAAHNNGISPFRTRIAEIFSQLEPKENTTAELKLFKKMISKARFIVTTNYDMLIEKELNNSIDVKIGNKGLFSNGNELGELYKIHGSISNPNSIVITENDYEQLHRTSAIINAKILSKLTESPILFLGYSLTDKNIQSVLKDLADNIPFSIDKASQRIGVVQYEKDKQDIAESTANTNYGVYYTNLVTDNFAKIYTKISQINQGATPIEISKYQSMIKQIIITKGKKGKLKHVLTSVGDLQNLPEKLKTQDIVVALGDSKYIYKYPDYVDYVKDYYLNPDNMPRDIALHFILHTSPQSTLPVSKYLDDNMTLNDQDREKINSRLKKFQSLRELQQGAKIPKMYIATLKKRFNQINKDAIAFLNNDDGIKVKYKMVFLIHHIKEIDAKKLVVYLLKNENAVFIKDTNTRKFLMAYSLLTEKIYKKI